MKKIYVIYHASCTDGSAARFAAYKKFGDSAEYIAVNYNEELPKIEDGSEVYILDFSYKRDILDELNARVKKLVVLDHHKTAKEELQDAPYAIFDMNKSGCVLAWEYFHPGIKVPQILEYIQDRDLWKFKFEDQTRFFSAGWMKHRDNMDKYRECEGDPSDTWGHPLTEIMSNGRVIVEHERGIVESFARKAVNITFEGHKTCILNLTSMISEVGHALYTSRDINFSMSYFITDSGYAVVSLRAKEGCDVSHIAKKYGGGGHPTACGFALTLRELGKVLRQEPLKRIDPSLPFTKEDVLRIAKDCYSASICIDKIDEAMAEKTLKEAVDVILDDTRFYDEHISGRYVLTDNYEDYFGPGVS